MPLHALPILSGFLTLRIRFIHLCRIQERALVRFICIRYQWTHEDKQLELRVDVIQSWGEECQLFIHLCPFFKGL